MDYTLSLNRQPVRHQMEKSIFSDDYKLFLQLVRSARQRAGLTQEDVAKRLGKTQSFVSKCERGERRLDIVDVREFCRAIGTTLPEFVAEFEEALGEG